MNLGAIEVPRAGKLGVECAGGGKLLMIDLLDSRPQAQRVNTDELPITPLHVRLEADRTPSLTSSESAAETVIRWQTPPQFQTTITPQRSNETVREDAENQSFGTVTGTSAILQIGQLPG